ncbi:MAG: SDR family oxidoreductase [Sphingobium sp.]
MDIRNPFDFVGKVAVITGGGTGIGRASARLFAEFGGDIVVAGRKPEPLEETAAIVRALGRKATVVATDVRDEAACEALIAQAASDHGRIDFLVNNAGGSRAKSYATWTLKDFDDMMALNVRSVWVLSRAAAAHMHNVGGGAIVNISSGASLAPIVHSSPYGVAKAGVNNLTAVMAVDLGTWNVRVNCIAPGAIKSEGFVRAMEKMGAEPDEAGGNNPVGRAGWSDEIAWPVIFCCSSAAGYLNGQTIYVGGGPIGAGRSPEIG